MKKFIHKTLGSIFWVADERVEDYKAAGHKLAADSSAVQKPKEEAPVEEPKEAKEEVKEVKKTVKNPVRRTSKKK